MWSIQSNTESFIDTFAAAAQLLDHLKVTVPCVVVHVEPEVDGYALVALAHVMVPQAGQVQHVTFVQPELVLDGFAEVRILGRVRRNRINVHPIDIHRLLRWFYRKTVFVFLMSFLLKYSLTIYNRLNFHSTGGRVRFEYSRGKATTSHVVITHGRDQDKVLVATHDTINILVRILVHWNYYYCSINHLGTHFWLPHLLEVTARSSPIQKFTASGSLLNASWANWSVSMLMSLISSLKSSVRLEFCFWIYGTGPLESTSYY